MELTIDFKYDQILKLVKQLPYNYKKKLTLDIEKDIKPQTKKEKTTQDTGDEEYNDLQRFLLQGPLMSKEQFDTFKDLRKDFNRWLNK